MRKRVVWDAAWRVSLQLTLSCLIFVGCDVIDIRSLDDLSKAVDEALAEELGAATSEADPTRSLAGGRGARTMDSIEPNDSMRLYYQFIDDGGKVRFVERLDEVPEAWRERVGFVEMDRPPPLTPAEARKTWAPDLNKVLKAMPRRVAAVSRARQPQVILYSADWCGYCKLAKKHLNGQGIRYDERNVDIPSVAQELQKKTGRGGIPVLDVEGQILRGYKQASYDRLLSKL